MQLHPTRMTLQVAVAGAGMLALGVAARLAAVAAFGGAMLLSVAFGRALALAAITRLREAGFEMTWSGTTRVHKVARSASVELTAELHNRSSEAVRCVGLRPIVSGMLGATIEPPSLDLPPGGRARVAMAVRANRVGRWGVHGLALEVRGTSLGGEGLYEAPLLFASPIGIEVLPSSLAVLTTSARGGRTRRSSELGRPSAVAGNGDELRELRDHVPGDPFKRVAWKASARRGRLLVREMHQEERELIWLVVDASVELWAGEPGEAPLDRVVDRVADEAARRLRRGDRVGLIVVAARVRSWIPPEEGAAHGATIASALSFSSEFIDSDRSELDESAVAQRIVEHARPLDPRGLADLPRGDLDALAQRAEELASRAPFAARPPFAPAPREQSLRRYLAAFGIESPPRIEGERERTESALAQVLEKLATDKPRPNAVHVWAPPPSRARAVAQVMAKLRAHRIELRWSLPPLDAGVGGDQERRSPIAELVDDAVRARARAMAARGERLLLRLGARVDSPRANRVKASP
jgi:uncharacterized protein (DUF58 family)